MSWTTSDIDYWNPSSMWGTGLFAFTTGQASQVDADLTSYYLNSGTFKTILDSLSGLSDIKIGLTAGGSFTNLTNRYIGYNPSQTFVYVNRSGTVVEVDSAFVLIHEVVHLFNGYPDPVDPNATPVNDATYSATGPTVDTVNQILVQIGLEDFQNTSYVVQFSQGFADQEIGLVLGENYTHEEPIDYTRLGDLDGNTIDNRGRTDESRDLIIGHLGDDTIYGGEGNDHIYGDLADPTLNDNGYAGSDLLYGNEGNDYLYGGQKNDYLDGGDNTTWDWLEGGPGDDVFIMRGVETDALGGEGDDYFYIAAPGGSYYWIGDPEASDQLFWNGYLLTGGNATVIDFEWGDDPYTYDMQSGWLDENGIIYFYSDEINVMNINTPDGGMIIIEDYQIGDLGMTLNGDVDEVYANPQWDENGDGEDVTFTGPASNIVLNNATNDFINLDGAADALFYYGPNTLPTTFIV